MLKRNLVVVAAVGLLSVPAGIALAEPTIDSFLGPELPAPDAQRTTVVQESEKDRRETAQREAAEDRTEFMGTAARTPVQDTAKPHRIPDLLINTNP
jgi:hypothetical protein